MDHLFISDFCIPYDHDISEYLNDEGIEHVIIRDRKNNAYLFKQRGQYVETIERNAQLQIILFKLKSLGFVFKYHSNTHFAKLGDMESFVRVDNFNINELEMWNVCKSWIVLTLKRSRNKRRGMRLNDKGFTDGSTEIVARCNEGHAYFISIRKEV